MFTIKTRRGDTTPDWTVLTASLVGAVLTLTAVFGSEFREPTRDVVVRLAKDQLEDLARAGRPADAAPATGPARTEDGLHLIAFRPAPAHGSAPMR